LREALDGVLEGHPGNVYRRFGFFTHLDSCGFVIPKYIKCSGKGFAEIFA
jgi:hypothetical protein